MASVPGWLPAAELGVVLAAGLSLAVVRWLDRRRDWGPRRRSRLLLGVPWGTLVTGLFVLAVYLFVQGGVARWRLPVVIPYRSWSYLYPLGVVVAPFAHNGVGHLTGNLLGTAVLGTLAEYAWGHFPDRRGEASFAGPRSNPYVRAFVVFPAGAVLVGLLTSLFSWGPVVGFSGVVYAFAGFALVRYPIGTVVALTADDVVGLVYRALQSPVVEARAEPSFTQPWWAGVAVQGHLLGLFLGLALGALVLRRRERSPTRLWVGTLLVATSLSLWAVWWYRGGDRYVLYRGLGVVLVLALALLVTLALLAADREGTVPAFDVPLRTVGVLVLVFPSLVVGAAAVPLNLTTVADEAPPGQGPVVEVRDYTVVYAENVTDQGTSVVNLSVLGETTQVRTSGVIVVSGERHLWTRAVPAGRLAFAGRARVALGGPGWRETVSATRRGWVVAGNGTAYRVFLQRGDGVRQLAFLSGERTADPVLAGHRVTVDPTTDGFYLDVVRNNTSVAYLPMPAENTTVTGAGIEFSRQDGTIYAQVNETRVEVARRETYR